MNIALWILQCLLAVAFLAAGAMKIARSKEKISEGMAWAKDFAPGQIKLIGIAEMLGGLGLVLPGLTRILPGLTSLSGAALFVLMAGAVYTHVRLKETLRAVPAVVLAIMSCAVAAGRFFIQPL